MAGFLHGMLLTGGDVELSGRYAGFVAAKKIENNGVLPVGDYSKVIVDLYNK
ncbi:MAG: hypothetical protein U9O53_01140 [archaeon]|nr:hypothetical protein [archaeon]